MKNAIKITALSLLLSLSLAAAAQSAADAEKALPYNAVEHDERDYSFVGRSVRTYSYGFDETDIKFYSSESALSTSNLRTGMAFENGRLSCVADKTFSFGSAVFLGDDYGLYGGRLSFDSKIGGGRLCVGVRLSKKAADPDHRGIWFSFEKDSLTVTEPESGLSASFKTAAPSAVTVCDEADVIKLYSDKTLLCSVTYDAYTGALAVLDPSGKKAASTAASNVRSAGYFTLYADKLDGYIDDVAFEHTDITLAAPDAAGYAIDYTTWIATDDRGRTTATGTEIRENKQVGMFYFLCHTGEDTEFLQDNTRIYTETGLEGLNDHLSDPKQSGSYYWAEPYYGYYKSTDEWVFRKHAFQLEAAGVDYIFLDFTNGAFYPDALQKLFDTWLQIRKEGGQTPDICVFCAGRAEAVMGPLHGMIYSDEGFEKYGELFYRYKGKPLLLCSLDDNDKSDLANWIRETFTVRNCWAWQDENGTWNWLQEYKKTATRYRFVNGGKGRDKDGNFEQLALCVGHHPTTSKGRSYANTVFPEINGNDYGFSLDSGAGAGYAAQFEAIMYYDPDMVTITGWNEWIAGLSHYNEYDTFAGSEILGFQFVDQFNTEYSRDAEPMRMRQGDGVGFGDNYYYQTVDYIRKYKGTGAVSKATGQISVDMTDLSVWDTVGPVYGDNVGDTAWRSEDGYFTGENYVNGTGRNDIVSAKVSQDSEYLYFQVKTAHDVIKDDGRNWMNLFINTDNDASTGWEGFDLVLNRGRDGHYVSVESLASGWAGEQIGQALYKVDGDTMVIRLSKAVAGYGGKVDSLSFKWADNSTLDGDIMEFSELGDAAPDDRFAYLYICEENADQTPSVKYALLGADGGVIEAADENKPLTYRENTPSGPSGPGPNTAKPKKTVWKHSAALKAATVATGAVTGACAFTVILTLDRVKRKKKNK